MNPYGYDYYPGEYPASLGGAYDLHETILMPSHTSNHGFQMHSCSHCGGYHGGACPRIKAVEYHDNGTIKRIEYRE